MTRSKGKAKIVASPPPKKAAKVLKKQALTPKRVEKVTKSAIVETPRSQRKRTVLDYKAFASGDSQEESKSEAKGAKRKSSGPLKEVPSPKKKAVEPKKAQTPAKAPAKVPAKAPAKVIKKEAEPPKTYSKTVTKPAEPPKTYSKTVAKPAAKTRAKSPPKPAVKPAPKPEPKGATKPAAKPAPKPEPKGATKPAAKSAPEPESKAPEPRKSGRNASASPVKEAKTPTKTESPIKKEPSKAKIVEKAILKATKSVPQKLESGKKAEPAAKVSKSSELDAINSSKKAQDIMKESLEASAKLNGTLPSRGRNAAKSEIVAKKPEIVAKKSEIVAKKSAPSAKPTSPQKSPSKIERDPLAIKEDPEAPKMSVIRAQKSPVKVSKSGKGSRPKCGECPGCKRKACNECSFCKSGERSNCIDTYCMNTDEGRKQREEAKAKYLASLSKAKSNLSDLELKPERDLTIDEQVDMIMAKLKMKQQARTTAAAPPKQIMKARLLPKAEVSSADAVVVKKERAKHKMMAVYGSSEKSNKLRRCGECEGCMRDDCGQCAACADKPKFGGRGSKKKACAVRACRMKGSLGGSASNQQKQTGQAQAQPQQQHMMVKLPNGQILQIVGQLTTQPTK